MRVFISWSGEQSRQVALALREWLPVVIQAVQPYMSEEDTHAGERWLQKVSLELDQTNFSIICVTRENVGSPWLNFEAGALSKTANIARVVPLLHGFSSASDLAPPLGQFQAKLANEKGIKELLETVDSYTEHPLGQVALVRVFSKFWPDLEEQLDKIFRTEAASLVRSQRSDRELLEELLQLIRSKDSPSDIVDVVSSEMEQKLARIRFITELEKYFGAKKVRSIPDSGLVHVDTPPDAFNYSFLRMLQVNADELGLSLMFSNFTKVKRPYRSDD